MIKNFLLLLLLSSSLLAQSYNREECDDYIDVKKYIVAGSLDDPSPGGKTYSFKRIVNAIDRELLSGEEPDPKRFECLTNLHAKANEDATDYWMGRLARSTCADDDGNIPSMKPPDCDDDTWKKFHESKELIDHSANRVTKLTEDCISNDKGDVKSCETMASLKTLQEAVEPLAESKMDSCCDTETGPGFKVLRGSYTIEFGDLSDADLQKECYKRTRPGNSATNTWSDRGAGLAKCFKGLLFSLLETAKKWLTLADNLTDLGTYTELWNALSSPGLMEKMGSLLQTIGVEIMDQIKATTSCFTGEYQVEQFCKLSASVVLDFFIGGGIVKGIKFILQVAKAGVKDLGTIAKTLVASNTSKIASKIGSKVTPTSVVGRAAKSVASASGRVAARKTASHLARTVKPVKDFSKNLADKIKKFREKENIQIPKQAPGLNGSSVVAKVETPSVQASAVQTGSRAASGTSSAGGRPLAQLTGKAVTKIQKDIRSFSDLGYKSAKGKPSNEVAGALENRFVKPKDLAGKTPKQKMKIIEDAAEKLRNQVERLSNTKHKSKLSSSEREKFLDNIDDAVARLRSTYGLSPEVSLSGGVSSAASVTGVAGTRAGVKAIDIPPSITQKIDTSIPAARAHSTGSTSSAVIGKTSLTSSGLTNTSIPFANSLPKVDIKAITESATKLNKTLRDQLDDMRMFEERARANAALANPSASARSSVYANQGKRAISKDAIRRHKEVENLHKKGVINDEQALAMHEIVRVTESSATGAATRYSTRYISATNTNPTTFVLKEKGPPMAVLGVAVGIPLKASSSSEIGSFGEKQLAEENSDKVKDRYDESTVKKSVEIVQAIQRDPNYVRNKFLNLTTEEAVLDQADELRLRVKTVENTTQVKPTYDPEDIKEEAEELITTINSERDRALIRIRAAATPASEKAPASIEPVE